MALVPMNYTCYSHEMGGIVDKPVDKVENYFLNRDVYCAKFNSSPQYHRNSTSYPQDFVNSVHK